jgi:hypothetical protein
MNILELPACKASIFDLPTRLSSRKNTTQYIFVPQKFLPFLDVAFWAGNYVYILFNPLEESSLFAMQTYPLGV